MRQDVHFGGFGSGSPAFVVIENMALKGIW